MALPSGFLLYLHTTHTFQTCYLIDDKVRNVSGDTEAVVDIHVEVEATHSGVSDKLVNELSMLLLPVTRSERSDRHPVLDPFIL